MSGSSKPPQVSANAKISLEKLTRVRKIGRGPKSEVWLVKHDATAVYYCMKELDRSAIATREEADHVWNERRVLEVLSREDPPFPRTCRLFATMKDEWALYFVMEFIPGAPLHKHFQADRGFPLDRSRFYCAELVEILGALHHRGIIYRDLKASNVMVDGKHGRLRLVDFGFAKILEPVAAGESGSPPHLRRTASVCGTFHAMAPEVRLQDGVDPDAREGYTPAADWWSLGILLFEMITMRPPFGYRDGDCKGRPIFDLAQESPESVEFPSSGPLADDESARDFVCRLLDANPSSRLGSAGVDQVKAHPWFQDFNWARVAVERVADGSAPFLAQAVAPRPLKPDHAEPWRAIALRRNRLCRS